jgi:hypothetical protein
MEFIYFVIISLQLAIGIWTIRKRIIEQSTLIEMFRPQRVMKGHQLIFLKRINKQGDSSLIPAHEDNRHYYDDNFEITCLSISEGTYIAHGFSTFIVKLKK